MKKHTTWLAALAVCAMSSMALAQASPAPQQQPGIPKTYHDTMMDNPAYKARSEMRQVWAEHLVYTRNYIISATAGLPDAQVASNRLLQNATDLGNTLQPYYGNNSAQKLTTLMREHVMILAEFAQVASGEPVSALNDAPATTGTGVSSSDRTGTNGSTDRNMGGTTGSNTRSTGSAGTTQSKSASTQGMNGVNKDVDAGKLADVQRRLETNGKSIAAFLNSSNPNWKESNFAGMMQSHIQAMVDQITARANGDWQGDIQAFDQSLEHVFQFSDMLSQGIERQFPDRFAQARN